MGERFEQRAWERFGRAQREVAEEAAVTDHEHIEPGDPRYDGFRISELWLLCHVDSTDNQEGVIFVTPDAAIRHSLAVGIAIGTDSRRASHLAAYGREIAEEGQDVTLKHFVLDNQERFE